MTTKSNSRYFTIRYWPSPVPEWYQLRMRWIRPVTDDEFHTMFIELVKYAVAFKAPELYKWGANA